MLDVGRWLGRYPESLMKTRHGLAEKKLFPSWGGVGWGWVFCMFKDPFKPISNIPLSLLRSLKTQREKEVKKYRSTDLFSPSFFPPLPPPLSLPLGTVSEVSSHVSSQAPPGCLTFYKVAQLSVDFQFQH